MQPQGNVAPGGSQGVMQTEPVATIGGVTLVSVTTAIGTGIALSKAFGVFEISTEQEQAIYGFLAAMWVLGPLLILGVRQAVYAPASVSAIKQVLVDEDPNTPLTAEAREALAA